MALSLPPLNLKLSNTSTNTSGGDLLTQTGASVAAPVFNFKSPQGGIPTWVWIALAAVAGLYVARKVF